MGSHHGRCYCSCLHYHGHDLAGAEYQSRNDSNTCTERTVFDDYGNPHALVESGDGGAFRRDSR